VERPHRGHGHPGGHPGGGLCLTGFDGCGVAGLGVGHGEVEAGEARGDGGRVVSVWGSSWMAGAGTVLGAFRTGEGLARGEGVAEADDGSATALRITLVGAAGGAAAAGWPAPRVSVSAMPSPMAASAAAASATPDRKLISSRRA
jgi:hypothetical protein